VRRCRSPAGCSARCSSCARLRCPRPRPEEAVIALNTDRIGHRYPTYHYEVSREKIREYAAATGVWEDRYTADPAAVPAEEVVAPPTFAACFTVGRGDIFSDPELGAHWNLVHGSQEYDCSRAIVAGDLLACSPSIVDIVDRGKFELLTFQIDCTDARTGEHVLTSRSVIIFFKNQEG
jgi:hypothetical protein